MGEVEEEDALFSLALRRVHYNMDQSCDNRLLWRAKVEKSVRAGSLARLVRQLAPLEEEEVPVSAYRTCFLATYRTFASAVDVLGHVTDWYVPPHKFIGSQPIPSFSPLSRYLALIPTGDTPPAEADTKRRAQKCVRREEYCTNFLSLLCLCCHFNIPQHCS